MADRSPFRVMCNMWGLDIALEKARSFGIAVTEEEIQAETKKNRDAARNLSSIIRGIREGDKDGEADD